MAAIAKKRLRKEMSLCQILEILSVTIFEKKPILLVFSQCNDASSNLEHAIHMNLLELFWDSTVFRARNSAHSVGPNTRRGTGILPVSGVSTFLTGIRPPGPSETIVQTTRPVWALSANVICIGVTFSASRFPPRVTLRLGHALV